MSDVLLNVGLIFCFIVIGGLFAAAEIALVSLREGQVRTLADRGRRGAAVARLASEPNRFLSAVQIGVTLAGFLSAAFGGATLADDLAPTFVDWGMSEGVASAVALVLITIVISYFSIVLSELVAKRLALQRTVPVALALAPSVDRIARISKPVIWLLSVSTDAVVRLLGGDPTAAREEMTEEELRLLVRSQTSLSDEERQIVDDVFSAGDRQVREVMLPRTEVDFMDGTMPVYKAIKHVASQAHSRYPVIGETPDDVLGFIHVRDLMDPYLEGRSSVHVADLARDVPMVPGTLNVLAAMSNMRSLGAHLAIVIDEYGGTDGIVTLEDLVEELIGDIRDEYDAEGQVTERLTGGDVEVDGLLNLDDFAEETGIELPEGPYETVAGYLIAVLGRVPTVDDECEFEGYRLRVSEMDGRRVARIHVSRA
ncbi:hemolysin family protein [Solicola gregarius]|uniref:Hemolysin family protein n=1 Tax=Solicola gregarius TaxID=2908642 RepID=A0AA46TEL8_9ACTN|nr:hemolysin family protein [Solicola gregarius]UYM03937.1 hemolysin family protein [Solicola gregarius]